MTESRPNRVRRGLLLALWCCGGCAGDAPVARVGGDAVDAPHSELDTELDPMSDESDVAVDGARDSGSAGEGVDGLADGEDSGDDSSDSGAPADIDSGTDGPSDGFVFLHATDTVLGPEWALDRCLGRLPDPADA